MAIAHTYNGEQRYTAITDFQIRDGWSEMQRALPVEERISRYAMTYCAESWPSIEARNAGAASLQDERRIRHCRLEADASPMATAYAHLEEEIGGTPV